MSLNSKLVTGGLAGLAGLSALAGVGTTWYKNKQLGKAFVQTAKERDSEIEAKISQKLSDYLDLENYVKEAGLLNKGPLRKLNAERQVALNNEIKQLLEALSTANPQASNLKEIIEKRKADAKAVRTMADNLKSEYKSINAVASKRQQFAKDKNEEFAAEAVKFLNRLREQMETAETEENRDVVLESMLPWLKAFIREDQPLEVDGSENGQVLAQKLKAKYNILNSTVDIGDGLTALLKGEEKI
jgi:hypothetical protein